MPLPRRAFIEDGSTRIRHTTAAQHEAMLGRITYLYQQGTVPVTLSVVSNNGNITPQMTDTRYRSGTAAQDTSNPWTDVTYYPPESATGEPELITGVTYDKISQTITNPGSFDNSDYQSLNTKPIYMEDDQTIREMSFAECLDTFIFPVVQSMLATNGTSSSAGGSYFISTSVSVSNCANLGTVFADTFAELSNYSYTNIGQAGSRQDVPTTTTYYMHRVNSQIINQGFGYRTPLIIDTASNRKNTPTGLRHMTYAEFDSLFGPMVKAAIYGIQGYTVRYNINGNGRRQGTLMANRQMIGVTGAYRTREATGDDYRAQEFPNGTLVNESEWALNLEIT
jgi:hypothetical protein